MRVSHLWRGGAALLLGASLAAEEGMWTFDNPPTQALKQRYQFEPTQAWLDHLRLSVISLGGCTGSFVSAQGLVLTNHHCVRGYIQSLSTGDRDLMKNGFTAHKREQEIKIPNLTWRVLMQMENITSRVEQAVKPGTNEQQASEQRALEIDRVKQELEKKTGLNFRVVSLYQGGETWMYGFKEFTDIRLVAAPELAMAGFGGDPDNFTYPRHDLDFTLLRIYENGKPYRPAHFLRWNPAGLKEGDLTFTIGHPGRTNRMQTYAQMVFDRDHAIPDYLRNAERSLAIFQEYAKRSPEHARKVQSHRLGITNGIKATEGGWVGLKEASAMARMEAAEKALRQEVSKQPELASVVASWERIEGALAQRREGLKEARHLGNLRSTTFGYALALARLATEEAKTQEQRHPDYQGEALKALRKSLSRNSPIAANPELEHLQFVRSLEDVIQDLGAEHPFVTTILAGGTVEEVARLLDRSTLGDAKVREGLVAGGAAAIQASKDPLLQLALRLQPLMAAQQERQDRIKAVMEEHGARIAKARFRVYGKTLPPDATGTLRIAYGAVATYPANGTLMQPFTTFLGLYDRHFGWGGNDAKAQNGEWMLPALWLERMDKLDLKTPFNFVHATDTTGGNSGSPVVNRQGELVGLLFDGNIESTIGRFYYDEQRNRSVSVDIRAIAEALTKVYQAPHLVHELQGK